MIELKSVQLSDRVRVHQASEVQSSSPYSPKLTQELPFCYFQFTLPPTSTPPHFQLGSPNIIIHAHVQGIKQSVCPSVVIGMKIPRSRILGICVASSPDPLSISQLLILHTKAFCACCKHNQLVDIGENLFVYTLTSTINHVFSIQHACDLSTTPTLLVYAAVTVHAQPQCWKGSSNHKTAL